MTVPANKTEEELLAEFARELADELGVSNRENAVESIVSKIRWYPNKAGAVVIVRRGADRKVLATISPKSGRWSHLYPSWKPVLAELEKKKEQESVSRRTHDDIEHVGSVPLAESEEK